MAFITPIIALAASIIVLNVLKRLRYEQHYTLPPGPQPWPIIGCLPDMPTLKPWITYRDWAKEYGIVLVRHWHVPEEMLTAKSSQART